MKSSVDVPLRNGVRSRLNTFFLNESHTTFFTAFEDEDSKKDDGISFSLQSGPAWAGSERDYTYDEVMLKVFQSIFHVNVLHQSRALCSYILFPT